MKILALDTSSVACSVALLNNSEVKMRHELIPLQHAQSVLSFIEDLLGSELNSLDALAWGCGPGSFTGLRIAASVIQALSFATELPVVSVSSLAALAQTAYQEHGWKQLLVAVDARMREVYWGVYRINPQGFAELVGEEKRSRPEDISISQAAAHSWYAAGDAWSVYQKELLSGVAVPPQEIDATCLPKALAVAQLGRLKYEKGEWSQAFDALPVYLRDNIAT